MATLLGNNVIVSGSSYARWRLEWQLAGQEIGNNRSLINWQGYVDFVNCDAQLDNGHVHSNQGGELYHNTGRVYNYTGNFNSKTIGLGSGSFWVGHDAAGNASVNFSGSVAVYQSGTSGNGGGNWALPTIPRYTTITQFYTDLVNDQGFRINWAAADHCDYVSWWSGEIDGGANHDIPVNGAGLFQITQNNLPSDKLFGLRVAVRRSSSGLWTESGWIQVATLKQNNFFGMRIP